MHSISVEYALLIDDPGPTRAELEQRIREEVNEMLARDARRDEKDQMFRHAMVLNLRVNASY